MDQRARSTRRRIIRTDWRRARQALAWCIAFFCLYQLAADLLLDLRWPQARSPYLEYVFQQARASPRPPEALCLGTSRFALACDVDVIQARLREVTGHASLTVLNGALAAGDLPAADYVLKKLLREGRRPNVVIIEVCPETVARRNRWMGAHVMPTWQWREAPTYLGDMWRSGNLWRIVLDRLYPSYLYRQGLRRECGQLLPELFSGPAAETGDAADSLDQTPETADSKITPERSEPGSKTQNLFAPTPERLKWFLESNVNQPPEIRSRERLFRIANWLRDYQLGGTSTLALERLLGRCRRHQIQTVLLAPPLTSFHRELYTAEIDSAFVAYMRRLEQSFGCRFADYRRRLPNELFIDHDHLMGDGVVQFSRLLADEIIAPAWKARR